ncbi:MAG TPA: hypothetical protein VI489_06035 [Candidatus Brocadiaceae bacterium]
MEKFKGTPGKLELKYVSRICIGIGTVEIADGYSQITANSILPETDKEYKKERVEIEANMTLYASSPELLEALQECRDVLAMASLIDKTNTCSKAAEKADLIINKALNIKQP